MVVSDLLDPSLTHIIVANDTRRSVVARAAVTLPALLKMPSCAPQSCRALTTNARAASAKDRHGQLDRGVGRGREPSRGDVLPGLLGLKTLAVGSEVKAYMLLRIFKVLCNHAAQERFRVPCRITLRPDYCYRYTRQTVIFCSSRWLALPLPTL